MDKERERVTGGVGGPRDTVTFKTHKLSVPQILSIFEIYGRIRKLSKYQNRYFIQFETPAEAKLARSALKDSVHRVVYAHTRTQCTGRISEPDFQDKDKPESESENSDSGTVSSGESTTCASSDESVESKGATNETNAEEEEEEEEGAVGGATAKVPTKAGKRSPPKKKYEKDISLNYSMIVANIPRKYTVHDVFNLVEEVKPIAISEIDYSKKRRIKFCEIFVRHRADIGYLKYKLHDLIICGEKLYVTASRELLQARS